MEKEATVNDCSSINVTDPGFNYLTKTTFLKQITDSNSKNISWRIQ